MKVMHYYTYPENSGGPLSYIKNIINSKYLSDVEFAECYQMKPFSSLKRCDFKRIVNEIKEFNPDILHIHGLQSEGFIGLLAARKAGVKSLMTVHGIQIDAQDIGSFKKKLFGGFIEPYTLKKSDAVYCVCKAMENRDFIKKNSKKLLPTLYNFIPDSFLADGDCAEGILSHESKTVITYAGRVTREKGMREFEYCVMNDTFDDTVYWVLGDGEYRDEMGENLKEFVKAGKVVFFGQQKNVKPYLAESDIFFFPTYHENLSLALLEAGSQGCCCVVTDVGGNPEVVENGVSGITFEADNLPAAFEALNKAVLSVELRKEYSEKLYNKIRTEFSEQTFSEKLLKIYENLL